MDQLDESETEGADVEKCDTHIMGMIGLAEDFYLAAGKLKEPGRVNGPWTLTTRSDFVAYYLASHSIELCLKAYLFGQGVPEHKLWSREYGHNLAVLIDEAMDRGLGEIVVITQEEVALVKSLNAMYKAKGFEYHSTGTGTLPAYAAVLDLNQKLGAGLSPDCHKRAGVKFTGRLMFGL